MRTALEGAVVLYFEGAESLPTHEVVGELEGAVLHQLTVEAAIGSIVDVFKEQSVHCGLYGSSQLCGLHIHDVLCLSCKGACQCEGAADSF